VPADDRVDESGAIHGLTGRRAQRRIGEQAAAGVEDEVVGPYGRQDRRAVAQYADALAAERPTVTGVNGSYPSRE
jgi:hypothetical protein